MKKLKNLIGARELSRDEKKAIKGGKMKCLDGGYGELPYCHSPYVCINGSCVLSPE